MSGTEQHWKWALSRNLRTGVAIVAALVVVIAFYTFGAPWIAVRLPFLLPGPL